MASIDLPRALQDYFAFAETTPTRSGRRFCITLSYVRADGRLDRLQWWYHLSVAREMALGGAALESLRSEAIQRFSTHIERWLHNTRQDMFGDETIPYVAAEGNRVVAAYRVDPGLSEGMPVVDLSPADPPIAEPAADGTAERTDTGTPERSDHRPTNKSAFG